MSTINIMALKDVAANMGYTELGRGERYKQNRANFTNRIAYQLGDFPSRQQFVTYCQEMRLRGRGSRERENEGHVLRISWAPEEMSVDNPDDVRRAAEYSYELCKEVAPNAACWVTVHTDSDGGCLHTHCTIANHDFVTGDALSKGMNFDSVQPKNDELSVARGFSTLSPVQKGSQWSNERERATGFRRALGDKVDAARQRSRTMDEFKAALEEDGIELKESKGGWAYRMWDDITSGKKPRVRRSQASNLAADLTKDAVEQHFLDIERTQGKQSARTNGVLDFMLREQERIKASYEQGRMKEVPVHVTKKAVTEVQEDMPQNGVEAVLSVSEHQVEDLPGNDKKTSQNVSESVSEMQSDIETEVTWENYQVSEDEVNGCLHALFDETGARCEDDPEDDVMRGWHRSVNEHARHMDETTRKLQEEVDRAREEFRAAGQAKRFAAMGSRLFLPMTQIFGGVNQRSKDPVARMWAQMMMQMFMMLEAQRKRDEQRQAEQRLYGARKGMWDAEKRLKAHVAVNDEETRHADEEKMRLQEIHDRRMEEMSHSRVGQIVKKADVDISRGDRDIADD